MTYKKIFLFAAVSLMLAACSSEDATGVIFSSEKYKLDETSISLTKDAASRTLIIESNCDWDFKVEGKSDNWNDLNIQKSSGGLTIQTDANTSRLTRQATIVLTTKGGITRTVSLSQAQGDVQLETKGGDNKTLTFLYGGGKQEVTVTSKTSWQITGAADWLTLDKQNGTGTDKVVVTVNEIQTDVARNATLVVSAESGTKTDYIIVQQQGKAIELSVSPQSLTFAATGGSKEIQVVCNADWTATASDEWVQLSAVSGTQSKSISITIPECKQQTQRSATITITSGSNKRETVNITQEAAVPPVIGTLTLVSGSVGRHEATLSFSVASAFPITSCGLCYSETNTVPTLSDTRLPTSSTATSVLLSGLEAGATYHVRAYATSDIGTTYSENVVTITTSGSEPGSDDNPFPNPR